jgi:hypothetical protein
MQVAVRKPSKGTSIALWQHEFYAVNTRKCRGNTAKQEVDIYQALEFRKGSDMPEECRAGLSEKQLEAIWVYGVYYAPASVIRRANVGLRKDRYIFQKDNSDDWEPCPQYKAALGKCPELVRVENCMCWNAMVDVLHMLPRVVHPVDVQRHEICVNGRDWHYLCGVIGTEHLFSENGKNRPSCGKDGFHLKLLDRKQCVMYPEETLGGFINSASAQWQVVDALFQGMRDVMRSGTAFTSGTFSIAWTNACQKFWEVRISHVVLLLTARSLQLSCLGTDSSRFQQKVQNRTFQQTHECRTDYANKVPRFQCHDTEISYQVHVLFCASHAPTSCPFSSKGRQ